MEKHGYRHIDTASLYENEAPIGRALKDIAEAGVVAREDIFVTTKLWRDDYELDKIEAALDTSLEKLQLDYVDLYLVHWTFPKIDYTKTPVVTTSPSLE